MLSLFMLLLADFCFMMFLLQASNRVRYLYSIHSDGERCEGVIIDMVESENQDNDLIYDPVIEFQAHNERHIFPADRPAVSKPEIGKIVNVRYLKGDPATAMVEPGDRLARLIMLMAVFCVVFLVINWMWITSILNNYL